MAVTFRDEELVMIVPAALYVVVTGRPWRRLGALAGCFLIPVGAYLGWFGASHAEPGFTTFSGAFLYGRVADFASCQGLNLPSYERPLCPSQPPAQRNADFYTWDPRSPQWTFRPPGGMSRDAVVRDFGLRILRHRPLAYAEAAGRDFLYGFSPVRGAGPERYSPAYLQFHPYIPPDRQADASIGALGYTPPAVRRNLASFLTGYGRWFYVPGPVFAGGLGLALAGVIAGARRRDKRASEGLLFTASAVLVLIPPALFATFDWRYQLPQLTLIPVAAVLGAAVGACAVGTPLRGVLEPSHGLDQLRGGHGQHVVRDEDVSPDQAAVEVDDEPAPGCRARNAAGSASVTATKSRFMNGRWSIRDTSGQGTGPAAINVERSVKPSPSRISTGWFRSARTSSARVIGPKNTRPSRPTASPTSPSDRIATRNADTAVMMTPRAASRRRCPAGVSTTMGSAIGPA